MALPGFIVAVAAAVADRGPRAPPPVVVVVVVVVVGDVGARWTFALTQC